MAPLEQAVTVLRDSGVIAYPTEFCYGLGCDPRSRPAVERILAIKQRAVAQGLVLVASNLAQVAAYAQLDGLARYREITETWPGPVTWVLPAQRTTDNWITGQHTSVAVRVSAHPVVAQLCTQFDGAIVSTSANRHGEPALLSSAAVSAEMDAELDFVLAGTIKAEASGQRASKIFDAISGEQLR